MTLHERFAHTERLASQGRRMHHPCGEWGLTKLGPFYCAVAVCVVSCVCFLGTPLIYLSTGPRQGMQPWNYLNLVLCALLGGVCIVLVCGGVGMGVSAMIFGFLECIRLLHGWAKSQARHDQQIIFSDFKRLNSLLFLLSILSICSPSSLNPPYAILTILDRRTRGTGEIPKSL